MKVYLIRHGETTGNVEKFHQGWGSVGLTEKGTEQAKKLKNVITKKKFDRIICSDLLRTRQTCSILFGERDDIEYEPRIREINNSVLMGQHGDELYLKYGEPYREDCRRLDYSAYGGESAASLLDRTADFLRELQGDTMSKRIAVVTHGGTIHAMLSFVLGMPLYSPPLRIENCSVTLLEYTDGWTVRHINNKIEI